MNKLFDLSIRIFIACLLLFLSLPACSQLNSNLAGSSPFPRSTPEEQGMDSKVLLETLNSIERSDLNIHGLLVLRNGKLVLEAYFPPFTAQDKHMLFSATKSFVSALVGIAIHEGKIQGVDQPVLDFFQNSPIENLDERKQNIHLHDLLNMTSGLYPDDMAMGESADWGQFTLDQPMVSEPGGEMEYNSGNSQLLAEIVERSTGKSAAEYAQEVLFEPLGIEDFYWASDQAGSTLGGVGLMLTPRDMARFGLLYLDHGQWEGNQVVPAEWVEASIQKNDGYAYQWWKLENGYSAVGWGGQAIYINPDQNLVVVITAALPAENLSFAETVADFMIPKAVKSDQPLPSNPVAQELAEKVKEIANPQAQAVPEFPAMAEAVNGKTLNLDENPLGWKTSKLVFEDGQAWLAVTTAASPEEQKFEIGLDGVYRLTELKKVEKLGVAEPELRNFLNPFEFNFLLGMPVDGAVAMKGAWAGEERYNLVVQDTRDYDRELIIFQFAPPLVTIKWLPDMDLSILTFDGRIE